MLSYSCSVHPINQESSLNVTFYVKPFWKYSIVMIVVIFWKLQITLWCADKMQLVASEFKKLSNNIEVMHWKLMLHLLVLYALKHVDKKQIPLCHMQPTISHVCHWHRERKNTVFAVLMLWITGMKDIWSK